MDCEIEGFHDDYYENSLGTTLNFKNSLGNT